MNRTEFLQQCAAITEAEKAEEARKMRERAGERIPPTVAAFARSLDTVTTAEHRIAETAVGKLEYDAVRANDAKAPMPIVINVHGGGWCLKHSERDVYFCRRMAVRTGCLFLDLDYGLSPEHPYPYAIEQIEGFLNLLPELAETLGGDPRRVQFCGQSSGANLLAAVSQRRRYTDRVRVIGQVLGYPPADILHEHFDGQELDERGRTTELYGVFYCPNFEDRKNSDVSIALARPEELRHVPATDMMLCGHDVLNREGQRYYEALLDAGVPVTQHFFAQSRHSFLVNMVDEWQDGDAFVAASLNRHLQEATEEENGTEVSESL